jgi:hypothetical protein
LSPKGRSATVPTFAKSLGNQPSKLEALQRELVAALKNDGLFADEAAAMLATWRLSYFESEGLRVFFLLPQAWTDARLPLAISTPAKTTRVMVGRVELVTTRQREALDRLYAFPDSDLPMMPLYAQDMAALKLMKEGKLSHSELYRAVGREVPEPLRLYESLGRFRDALLAHEWQNEADATRRARLERLMRNFSACVNDLRAPQITEAKQTTVP